MEYKPLTVTAMLSTVRVVNKGNPAIERVILLLEQATKENREATERVKKMYEQIIATNTVKDEKSS